MAHTAFSDRVTNAAVSAPSSEHSDSVWQFFIFCIPKSCPARINYMAGRWPALVRLAMDHLCNNKGYWISAAEPDDGKG